jgi:NADPH:quinone reductase-like Zn-dependent oxidoreductase
MNSNKMKAVVCTKYGPPEVLQFKDVNKPIPKNNELLIRVCTVFVGMVKMKAHNMVNSKVISKRLFINNLNTYRDFK